MNESLSNELSASSVFESKYLARTDYEFSVADPEEFLFSPEFLNGKDWLWTSVVDDFVNFYQSKKHEGIWACSIGAGKSVRASLIAAYEAHQLLALRNPQKTFGLARGSKIAVMNMSINAMQAKDVVFGEVKARVDDCYWFKAHFPYNPKVTSRLVFPKGVYIIPGNSRETKILGYNVYVGILDEVDHFIDKEGTYVAEDVYLGMQRRAQSRFKRFDWKLVAITSPRHKDSFSEQKMHDDDCFRRRLTLWEAKPQDYAGEKMVPWDGYTDPATGKHVLIPESLIPMANKNAIKFMRDVMAIPAAGLMPYFPDPAVIDRCVNAALTVVENGALPEKIIPPPRAVVAHIDLALSKDAAGVAIGHAEGRKVIIDIVWRIKPDKGTEVNFAAIREMILSLRKSGWRFARVSYDGWQSVDSIQLLTAKGIECERLSVDSNLEPYDTMKELANEGLLQVGDSPTFKREAKALELIKGKKVDHPTKGSKDVTDAIAGVCYWLKAGEISGTPQGALVKRPSGPAAMGRYERSPY